MSKNDNDPKKNSIAKSPAKPKSVSDKKPASDRPSK
jgi:hypothetical protein